MSLIPNEEPKGEMSRVVEQLLAYAQDKGQIPDATSFAIIKQYLIILQRRFPKAQVIKELDKMIDNIVELSKHEPAIHETVAQRFVRIIGESVQAKMEIVEQHKKKLPVFGERK